MRTRAWIAAALLLAALGTPVRASLPPLTDADAVLRALRDELARSVDDLRLDKLDKPYFIQYEVLDVESATVEAANGALLNANSDRNRSVRVDVRVGSYEKDSRGGRPGMAVEPARLALDDAYGPLRHSVWLQTDKAYRQALQSLEYRRHAPSEPWREERHAADLSHETPLLSLSPRIHLDCAPCEWEDVLRRLSAVPAAFPERLQGTVSLRAVAANSYILNNEGTVVRKPDAIAVVTATASAVEVDGDRSAEGIAFCAFTPHGLPAEKEMAASIRAMAQRVIDDRKAAMLEDEYVGPALFVRQAAGSVFAELLVPQVCWNGERLRKPILPAALNVVDDPTLDHFGDAPLLGHYAVDDEGVPAQRVSLVERGVLKRLLASRTPTKHNPRSNGHGRSHSYTGGAFISNLMVQAEDGRGYEELKAELLRRCREQALPYGIIARVPDVPGGVVADLGVHVQFFKVSVRDGHEELLRDVQRERLEPRALKRIVAVGRDASVTHFVRGTTASVVSPSILLGEILIAPRHEMHGEKPLLTPPPR